MTDDIKNSTPDPGAAKRTVTRAPVVGCTGDQLGEPVTVDVAPDSMAGMDPVAMLRGDGEPEAADASESEAINDGAEHVGEELSAVAHTPALDGRQERVEDLEAFELPYADGSTTPPKPAKRHRLRPRQRTVPADHELEAAIAETTTDVWAAHRNDPFGSDTEPASGQPIGIPTASEGQDRSRGRRPLALVAVVAVVVAARWRLHRRVVAAEEGVRTQASRTGATGRAKAHHKAHTPTSPKPAASPKHRHKSSTRRTSGRCAHSTVTTSTGQAPRS